MRLLLTSLLLTLPLVAFAQSTGSAPMVMVSQGKVLATAKPVTPQVYTPDFPDWAITQVGQATGGNNTDQPDAAPQAPQAPTAPQPDTAAAPATPATPPSPVSKLWPRDTVPIFVRSCVGFHIELLPACTCVINKLMGEMPHDEFLELSQRGTIEQDTRLQTIRQQCAVDGAAEQQQQLQQKKE